jgi:hypothetical protein
MRRAVKIILHGLGVLGSALAGYLLAIAIIAFIPLAGPFGKTWIFMRFLYVLFATPRPPND